MRLRLLHFIWLTLVLASPARGGSLHFTKSHPLIIGIDTDYAPLEYIDMNGMPHGVDVEYTQELMQRMGIPYTYAPNAWKKISGDVIHGRVDLGMMVYSPYRVDSVNYSRAVFRLYYQIVYRASDESNFDVRNLSGKHIAFMASRPVKDTLTKVGARLEVVEDLNKTFKQLSEGHYDAIICFRYQARYIINKYGLDNLATEELTLTPREYCYVSRSKELIDAINPYLVQMEKDGTKEEIYGHVTSQFGGIEIPTWVWFVIAAVVLLSMLVVLLLQRRHALALRKEVERAQQSERLKTIFLGNVSHALRTPLNAIIGFSDLLTNAGEDSISADDRQELLRLINDNGKELLYFINELLQLSNIEGSQLELNLVDTNVGQLANEYMVQLKPLVAEGVATKVEGDGQLTVPLDLSVMQTLTMHLLKNAARNTSHGSITLRYAVVRNQLQVQVSDTGSGLPEDLKGDIFRLLAGKNTYVQNKTPGLGLSICKAIIDKLGGTITAQSETGKGTTVTFAIPILKNKQKP